MSDKKTNGMDSATLTIIIAGLLILINIGATFMIVDTKTKEVVNNVIAKTLALEYSKVWGKANYDKITNITREQTIAWLKQYDANGGAQPAAQPQAQTTPAPAGGELSQDQIKKIKDWVYIMWNPDVEVTWVEYSDLECPFCKKLHEAGTIDEVMKAYDWKVNFVFKQFPLDFHKQAPMEAEAVLCAWELAWKDKYYEFIGKVFEGSEARGNSYTKESISKLAWTIWIDEAKILSCIKSGKNKARADSEMKEWQSLFGITGTPWNVLINNKTGKWDKLPGAYPTASFKQKIDSLMTK